MSLVKAEPCEYWWFIRSHGWRIKLEGSHLGILEGFVSSCESGFDRLGRRLDFARSLRLAQPRAGMLQPGTTVKKGHCTSELSYSLAEVNLPLVEAV